MHEANRIICTLLADALSAFRLRQKRASFPSGQKDENPLTALTIFNRIYSKRVPNRVRVMRGTENVGIGVVVHPFVIAAKASIFKDGVQYHVEFPEPSGGTARHKITNIQPNADYKRLNEKRGGIHDVALAACSGVMPKNDFTLDMLAEVGNFTPTQITWIASKI